MDPKIIKMLFDLESIIANITGHYGAGNISEHDVIEELTTIADTMRQRIDMALNENRSPVARRLFK